MNYIALGFTALLVATLLIGLILFVNIPWFVHRHMMRTEVGIRKLYYGTKAADIVKVIKTFDTVERDSDYPTSIFLYNEQGRVVYIHAAKVIINGAGYVFNPFEFLKFQGWLKRNMMSVVVRLLYHRVVQATDTLTDL